MRKFTERDMADSIAGNDNISRLWGSSDHAVVLRRMHEFRYDGLSAASLAEAVASSGHSDPTVAAALADPDTADMVQVAIVHRWATRVLERAMANELTKPTTPTKAQAEATDVAFDSVAVFRPGAGTCEACGVEKIGGPNRNDRVQNVEGHELCFSHVTARYKPQHRGRTIDDFIHSVKLYRTASEIELHDPGAA